MKKTAFILSAAVMLSLTGFITTQAGWSLEGNSLKFRKADGSYLCDDSLINNKMLFAFDKDGNAIHIDSPERPYGWIYQMDEQEKKIQRIREVFNQINSRTDYQILQSDNYIDFVEKDGTLTKAVLKNDMYLTLPIVECYYENGQVIFIYGSDGVNEYRYYFEDSKLIREIGEDGQMHYLDGDGLQKTGDPKIEEILKRANWERALVAEDIWEQALN